MPIWMVAPVHEMPSIVLIQWQIVEVEPGTARCARHFVGYNSLEREGRVSSAIVRFDPVARTGLTASGRIYSLEGDPGDNIDAEWTWSGWKRLNGVETFEVVTERALRGE